MWLNMNSRCCHPSSTSYASYGARGIRVCDEWRGRGGFERFFAHVGPRPSSAHSIDRIDVDGDYAPGNVRWATRTEQAENTRQSVFVTHDGVTRCVSAWAESLGLNRYTVYKRIGRGLDPHEALFGPRRRNRWDNR